MPRSKGNSGSGAVPAVIYAAKSTEDKHGSIPAQITDCREGIEREGGRFLYAEPLSDENKSAYSGNRGPGLAEAKRLAVEAATEHGEAELWVQHSDRLARGDGLTADHFGEVYFALRRQSVRLRSVQDDGNMEDALRAVLVGERNTEDSRRKSKSIEGGMRRRAERGEYNGGPAPYGFRWLAKLVGDKLVQDLVHDSAAAAIVRRIFREFVAGKSQQQIARDLHREGVPAAKTEWRQATISAMLRNPIYVGRVRFKGEVLPGTHKPIIDEDTWNAAQQLLATTRRTRGNGRGRPTSGSHLFTRGMLKCGRCDGPIVPRTIKPRKRGGSPYEVYFCFNRMRDREACDQGPVAREEIDDPTRAYFADEVLDVDATLARLQATEDARRAEVTTQREQAERDPLRLAGERDRVERDYRAKDLSAKRYDELCDKIEEEQAAAAAQVEQLRAREQELSSENILATIDAASIEGVTAIRAAIVEHVRGAGSLDEVRAALLTMFKDFVLRDGYVEINPRDEFVLDWKFDPDPIAHPALWRREVRTVNGRELVSIFPLDEEAVTYRPVMRAMPLSSVSNNHSSSSPSQ
jgi:DNA invertase Pin-like site-specific DNA recombinase